MNIIETILKKMGYVKASTYPGFQTTQNAEAQSLPKPIVSPRLVSPQEIKLPMECDNHPITFSRINDGLVPAGYHIVPMSGEQRRDMYDFLSSATGLAANAGLSKLCGVYEATAPASQLMRYSDGTLSSAVRGADGKITAHKGFVKAGVKAFTPMLAFQALSIVTGQYFMNGIQKQLTAINEKLDMILDKLESANEGKLHSAILLFMQMGQQQVYTPEDLVIVRLKMADMMECYYNYVAQMNKVKDEFTPSNMKQRFDSCFTNKGNVEEAIKAFGNTQFFDLNRKAQSFYQAYCIGELLYAKMLASMMGDSHSAAVRYEEIISSFRSGSGSMIATAMTSHKQVLASVKTQIDEFVGTKLDGWYKDTIRKKQNEVHAQFEREFTVFDNEEIKSIRTMQGKLVENYDSPQKYIYECTEDGEAYVFSLSTGQK